MEDIPSQVKTRRQLQAEQTKDKLFEAAVSLLAEKDFEQITIRDIVAKAHVSIGTFYNYYSTKMEVFYETYRVADHYFSEVVAPALTQGTVYERILAFFDYYAHYNSDLTDMKMTRLLYNTDNPFFNRDPHQGMVGVLIELLREGLEQGELAGGDSADLHRGGSSGGPLGSGLASLPLRALRTSRARDRSGLNYVDDLLIHAWGRVLRGLSRLSTACNADRLLGIDGWCGDVPRYAIHAHPQEGARNQALVGDRTGITRKQNLAGGNAPEGVRPKYRGLCIAVPRVVKFKLRAVLVDSTGDECFSLRKGNHLANNL